MFLMANLVLFNSFVPALIIQIFLSLLIAYLMLLIADRYLKIEYGIMAALIAIVAVGAVALVGSKIPDLSPAANKLHS